MKAETLLIFYLNFNHRPILLHSNSEQLQNVNSEFLQGTSMCQNITFKEKMLERQWKEQHVRICCIALLISFCPRRTPAPFFCPK